MIKLLNSIVTLPLHEYEQLKQGISNTGYSTQDVVIALIMGLAIGIGFTLLIGAFSNEK